MKKELLILGGTNIDIVGAPKNKNELELYTSNIGTINISIGGVGKNIAYNLRLLEGNINKDSSFYFITALGDGFISKLAKENLDEIKIEYFTPSINNKDPLYLAINDNKNDLYVSICDNDIINTLNKFYFEKIINLDNLIENCKINFLVLDANLSEEAIDYLINSYYKKTRIIVEGVSSFKIVKFKNYLDQIYLLKCNELELTELCKYIDSATFESLKINEKLNLLARKYKLKFAIITNKDKDINLINNSKYEKLEIPRENLIKEEEIVSSNGVGDALLAAFLFHYIYLKESFVSSIKNATSYSKDVLLTSNSFSQSLFQKFFNQ